MSCSRMVAVLKGWQEEMSLALMPMHGWAAGAHGPNQLESAGSAQPKTLRSHIASVLELQLDQAVEKAETPRSRRSSKGRVAGSLVRDVLLFLLQLQDCEKQAGMTSPGLFWL